MTIIVLMIGVVGLAIVAQAFRIQRDYFAEEVKTQYRWIDEIITELKRPENCEEEIGNE
jgi:hypothetical protein